MLPCGGVHGCAGISASSRCQELLEQARCTRCATWRWINIIHTGWWMAENVRVRIQIFGNVNALWIVVLWWLWVNWWMRLLWYLAAGRWLRRKDGIIAPRLIGLWLPIWIAENLIRINWMMSTICIRRWIIPARIVIVTMAIRTVRIYACIVGACIRICTYSVR